MRSGKYIAFILFLLTAFQLSASYVVCTTYPIWLMTRAVAGNAPNIAIVLLMPADCGCAHDYTPAPQDLAKVMQKGTLLIANGLGLDDHIVNAAKKVNKNINVCWAAGYRDKIDAHYFINPGNAKIMLDKIAFILSKDAPDNKDIYYANKVKYHLQLNELSKQYKQLPLRKSVVLQSSTFIHLAKAANYDIILAKKEHDAFLSSSGLQKLLLTIKKQKPYAIWAEKGCIDPVIKMLKKHTKLPVIELDTMLRGVDEPPEDHFIKLMRSNLETLQKAAKQ
ncbi:MAG: zinc ABC transporter substrate-binding protein [Lentisphaerae bacterium]|nr:zinc ABC transporter substrate-binding protein [Lentisphaerota bacterium]